VDGNLAYIGATNEDYFFTYFGGSNWEIEHSRAPLLGAPTLYNSTQTGEIDAIGFINFAPFHLLRVMRCD
jgi:hypothetical protein